MRLAVWQCPPGPEDVPGNLERLRRAAHAAAAGGAALLVCPEMYLSGYAIGAAAARRLAEPRDGAGAQAVAAIAREHGLAILYGYPERADATVFNAVQLIGADGTVHAHYRKTHLYGALDRGMFVAGAGDFPLFELGGWRFGLLICYDVEFPETVRRLALAGADAVLVPTANMLPYDVVPDILVPARAYENQLYVAYANYCGREGEIRYGGRSVIVGPDGADRARAGRDETLLFADLDRAFLDESRRGNTHLADRRAELYAALARLADAPPGAE
ncbi:5-aminopentanamidase [Plasticicumulans lactativorans]|uniref:5-aminopentanamidase n=1 Tax=Plasticicumulans lactativorans TaxID=1133106 RepID=A0A4R2L940_9GAMM|nr:carbon-nitrogen hydrolase family protein [Plasticicumulans lactativorans]TCO80759.1 5-aminopentanamidase [Plasticicumulans lactativorans]